MHAASFNDHIESLEMLLASNGDVNKTDNDGRTPLMFVSMNGHCGTIELLLENGADLHAVNKDKNTALHYACMNVSGMSNLTITWLTCILIECAIFT